MYPNELEEYIKSRNYSLDSKEANIVLDIRNNPQLDHITYNCYNNSYDLWDMTGNHYYFKMK